MQSQECKNLYTLHDATEMLGLAWEREKIGGLLKADIYNPLFKEWMPEHCHMLQSNQSRREQMADWKQL